MALWNGVKDEPIDPSADPDTGTVKDNRDGQFEISYRLTRAGMYRMDLQVTNKTEANFKLRRKFGASSHACLEAFAAIPFLILTGSRPPSACAL